MSEQPASAAPSSTAVATTRVLSLERGMGVSLGQVEDVADRSALDAGGAAADFGAQHLRLVLDEEVHVVRRQAVLERRRDGVARTGRLHHATPLENSLPANDMDF